MSAVCKSLLLLLWLPLLLLSFLAVADHKSPNIRYGLTVEPNEVSSSTSALTIELQIIAELEQRLEQSFKYVPCPTYSRCHANLEAGVIDLLPFVVVNNRRFNSQHFVTIWELPGVHTPFYVRVNEELRLRKMSDLYSLRLGLLRGLSYSPLIDDNPRINSIYVQKERQLAQMLISGRIDTFIGGYLTPEYLDEFFPSIVLAPVKIPAPFFALVSMGRNSPHFEQVKPRIESAVQAMITEGWLDQMFQKIGYPKPKRRYIFGDQMAASLY